MYNMSSSRPVLAFADRGFDLGALNMTSMQAEGERRHEVTLARRNRHPDQRNVDSFDDQVMGWYSAVAITSYPKWVHGAMRRLVHTLGTGPWLSGMTLNWGDSQRGLLAMWIGHAIAAPTWKDEGVDDARRGLPLDYYIYSNFAENPGNQCLVHAEEACEKCLSECHNRTREPENSAFSLPKYALMGPNRTQMCVPWEKAKETGRSLDCGKKSFDDVTSTYMDHLASSLWDNVKEALTAEPNANRSIFDTLLLPNNEE